MTAHWFSVLSIAGFVLLAGNAFGGELRWATPGSSEPADSSILRIPTVISTDDVRESSALTILQVQAVEPILPPRVIMPPARPLNRDYPGAIQINNPLPGATLQTAPLPPAQTITEERNIVPCDESMTLKSIKEISHDIRLKQTGPLPAECAMDSTPYYGRHFSQTCVHWKASALSTKAAYFEDVQLERYGHTRYPVLQPVISGAKFFATIPILPYKMGVTPPSECVYTLGHYRSGNPSPYIREPFLISPR